MKTLPVGPNVPVAPGVPNLQHMMLGYDPTKPQKPVDVVNSRTGWSEFDLSDGTVIRVKGILIDAKKAEGQYAADGKPIYLLQMTLVNDLVVPDVLMKPRTA